MDYYNNILCFEYNWIVDNDIVTKETYKSDKKRKKFEVVRNGGRGRFALISYDSMPDEYKEAIIEKIGGDPYKLAKLNALEDLI